jgi:hypothetical protein
LNACLCADPHVHSCPEADPHPLILGVLASRQRAEVAEYVLLLNGAYSRGGATQNGQF